MSEDRRRELGASDAPVEDELKESFDKTIEEGAERLHRTTRNILVTGVFGGVEIGLGIMAYLASPFWLQWHQTASILVSTTALTST